MSEENVASFPNMHDIEAEAAEWAVRLDGGDAPQELLAAFQSWSAQSAQHRAAAERFCDLWAATEALDRLNDFAESPIDFVRYPKRSDAHTHFLTRRAVGGAMAASIIAIAGLAIAGIAFYRTNSAVDRRFDEAFVTAIGEQRTIGLPDGSIVRLNTGSALDIEFSKKERRLRLSKGEAFFEVAPNPARPFSVETDRGVVTAVGTAFSVQIGEERMNVLVTKGRVALSSARAAAGENRSAAQPASAAAEAMEVSAGQSAAYNQRVEHLDAVTPEEIERQLDWQDGLLSFNGEPLSKVVAEISRYTDISIEIDDPQLAERRVVALYKIGRLEPMFEALRVTANVEIEKIGDKKIRLRQAR